MAWDAGKGVYGTFEKENERRRGVGECERAVDEVSEKNE